MRSPGIVSLTFGLACIAIAGMTGLELYRSARFGNLTFISNSLDGGNSISPDYVAANLDGVDRIMADRICRSDLLRAGASAVLYNLDQQQPNADFTRFETDLAQADRYFAHAVACQPENGDYWLRRALVRRQIAEIPDEQYAFLSKSVQYAPAEDKTLFGRLWLYTRLTNFSLKRVHPLLQTDLQRYMNWSIPRESLPLMKLLRQRFEPDIAAIAATLPPRVYERWRKSGIDFSKPPVPPSPPAGAKTSAL